MTLIKTKAHVGLAIALMLFAFVACSGDDTGNEGAHPPDADADLAENETGPKCPLGFSWNDTLGQCLPGLPTDGDLEGDNEGSTCKAPANSPEKPYFTDITDEMGIGLEGLAVIGNRIVAVDLNNDDYPDLVVHVVSSNKRDDRIADPPKIYKRILMNRPHPTESGKRIFEDVTDASDFAQTRDGAGGRSCQFAVFGDVDNNGTLDAFSATYVDTNNVDTDPGDRSEIMLNDGQGTFSFAEASDTTPYAGIRLSTTGASFLDYNRDGVLDLWVGFWYEKYGYMPALQNHLYEGKGDGTFKRVTYAQGLETTSDGYATFTNHKPTYGITVCDVNDDGNPDLIASSYGRQFNELWLNEGDGFRDISQESGFAGDDNQDYLDNQFYSCYCTVQSCDPSPGAPRTGCPTPADAYWSANDEQPWRLNGNTFSTLCGDWTGDGLPDLFNAEIVHWHIGQSSDPSELLVNETVGDAVAFSRPGRDATGLTRTHTTSDWNEGDITAVRFDYNLDGFPDLYLGDSDYPGTFGHLFKQMEDGKFVEIISGSGVKHARANGITVADIDRDGDLDLIVGSSTARQSPWGTAEVHVYRNDIGHESNAIRLTLEGKGKGFANRSAVGARVKVTTGDRVQTEWVQAGFGHFGMQTELPLTIGLGAACQIDELEIRWPNQDLTVQTFTDIPANVHIKITEGAEPLIRPLAGE